MKRADVHLGGHYIAKVSDRLVEIQLDEDCPYGGWFATNLATGRQIRIHSAAKLRREVYRTQPPLAPAIRL